MFRLHSFESALAAFGLVLAHVVAPFSASALDALALEGDIAPGTGGGTYTFFEDLSINESGAVAFSAFLSGGSAGRGLFVESATASGVIVLEGDPAPAPAVGNFAVPYGPQIADNGDVVFTSTLTSNPGAGVLFRASGGTIQVVALPGDPAPGSGGGTFSSLPAWPAANSAGQIAFVAGIANGNRLTGIYFYSGGVVSPILFRGDPAPGLSGTITNIFSTGLSINEVGEVAFPVTINDNTVFPARNYDAVYRYSGGVLEVVAEEDEIPVGGDGSAYDVFRKESTSISDAGDVVFDAILDGGTNSQGVFVDAPGAAGQAVMFFGDPAPGSGGGTFSDGVLPSTNGLGDIAFRGTILGGNTSEGVYKETGGSIAALAVEGDAAPGTAGGVFASFDRQPVVNDAGTTAFVGNMNGGVANRGIYTVPEPGLGSGLASALLGLLALQRGFGSFRSGGRVRDRSWASS